MGNNNDCGKLDWAHLRLPPFPQVALRVLQLAQDQNVPLHQLSEQIVSDPAFASEVLTIANSAFYAPRFPVSSVLQAIAVLGANHLLGVCLTVGVRAYLGRALRQPTMRVLWRHNLACALVAEELAAAGFLDKDMAYTSGILHDIGCLALAVVRPREYAHMLERFAGTADAILAEEKQLFGWDHCEIGRQLVVDWKLPDEFDPIVYRHHESRPRMDHWDMADLISVSCRMADTAGYVCFPGCETVPFEQLLEELPGRERRKFTYSLDELKEQLNTKIAAAESF